jgi:RNA polymerase sigma-70 factor (ECF subfamily)
VSSNLYNHITDNELIDRFTNDQNKEWLGIFLERYTLLLLGVCMKYLKNEEAAKDAVQQVFLKALSEMGKYPIQYPKSWLYKVACNYCLMQIRDQKKSVPLADNAPFIEETSNVEEHQIKEFNLSLLETCISELNKEQQTCITLFYLQKKSYQEISQSTGFSILEVKSHIQNGKRNLKILMVKKQPLQ